jgi:hypothetical protein
MEMTKSKFKWLKQGSRLAETIYIMPEGFYIRRRHALRIVGEVGPLLGIYRAKAFSKLEMLSCYYPHTRAPIESLIATTSEYPYLFTLSADDQEALSPLTAFDSISLYRVPSLRCITVKADLPFFGPKATIYIPKKVGDHSTELYISPTLLLTACSGESTVYGKDTLNLIRVSGLCDGVPTTAFISPNRSL